MKRIGAFLLFVALLTGSAAAHISVTGALYKEFDRCWIQLKLCGSAPADTLPRTFVPEMFEVTRLGDPTEIFSPARVDTLPLEDGCAVVRLASDKFEERYCYKVSFTPAGHESVVAGSLCYPGHPSWNECRSGVFFDKYIAPAFRQDTLGSYSNQFKYEYDASNEKAVSSLSVEPRFETHGFSFGPSFEQNTVAYRLKDRGKTSTDKEEFGFAISRLAWTQSHMYDVSCSYHHDRSLLHLASRDSTAFSQNLIVEGSIGLDNFLKGSGNHCVSVFKGVSLGFGYAWYQSNDTEVWGRSDFNRTTPFVNFRATWTILFGFQLSYSLYSFWPTSMDEAFTEFHSLRFRLLLRDALSAPSGESPGESSGTRRGKPYRPDLEFAFDTGKRLPLFEKEEKISLGFTFDLYPWEGNPSSVTGTSSKK